MWQPKEQQEVDPHSVDAFTAWVQKNRSPGTYEFYQSRLQNRLTDFSESADRWALVVYCDASTSFQNSAVGL